MAAGQYSAGTIFLQVVPVFRDTMDRIQDEAKKVSKAVGADLEEAGREGGKRSAKAYGEEMEKGSRDAGEKAGKAYAGAFETQLKSAIKSTQKEMDRLTLGDNISGGMVDDLERVKRKLKELKDIDFSVDFDSKKVLADVAIVSAAVRKMAAEDHDLEIGFNLTKVLRDLSVVEKAASAVESKKREIKFGADFDSKAAERQVGAFEAKFRGVMKKAASSLGDNLSPEILKARRELERLGDVKIGVDLNAADAIAKAQGIRTALEFLTRDNVDIDVDIDVGAAMAQLALLDHNLEKVERQAARTTATVGIMGALMAAFSPKANAAGSAGENAANSFRSFNFVILGAVTLLPALVPVLAAVGGGLLALIPILGALGAGLGVAILGFSGIGNALTEMGNVADEQAAAAGKAEDGARSVAAATHAVADAERALADARRNAARAAQDAARAVKDAREAAADAIEDALERQKDAQEEYRDAVNDVAEAEQDLRDARADAAADAASLADRQRKNAVDERQAVLDLFEAQSEYNAVMADGSSTNTDREQASINLEQAQIALNDTRTEQVALADEAADYAKNGVDGSEKVQSAQEALTSALEAQKDAQDAVKEAAEDAREVQIDAAEQVEDALRNQRRTAADSARAIADAQRALSRAQEGAAQAVTDAAVESTAAMDRLDVAMSKLSPAGRKFAEFLFGLRSGFREVRDEVQERMLPGIQRGMQALIDEYGPKFKNFAGDVADSLGRIGENTGEGLTGGAWQRFFETYGKVVPRLIDSFAESSGNWMTAWAGLFETIAPYAERLAEGLLIMSERAERFFNSPKGRREVREFMEYAFEVGPIVARFFGDLVVFAKDLAKAMAPIGELVIAALTGFIEWISSMDPKDLQLLVTGVLGLVIAFQLAVGVVALFLAGGAIFATAASTWVFIIVAVIAIVVALYNRFPIFRKIVDKAIDGVVKAFNWLKDIIVNKVVPFVVTAVEKIWKGVQTLWAIVQPYLQLLLDFWTDVFTAVWWVVKTFVLPVLEALWDAVMFLWNKVIKPYLGFIIGLWVQVFEKAWWVIKNIVLPVIDLLAKGIMYLYRSYVKPYFQRMAEAWEGFSDRVTDAYTKYLKPAFDFIGDYIADTIAPKFQTAVDLIGSIWAGLKAAFADPVRFMIDTVINKGLIAGFNWVADKVGSKPIDPFEVPEWAQDKTSKATGGMLPWGKQSRAVGGMLPGYSPGRDNYSFYNPQLGELNLGGGEGILRPEVVRAAGGEPWINGLNHAAMSGGVTAVQKKLFGSFAKGGKIVFPVQGGYVNRTPYNLGHDGMDINHPMDATGKVPYFSATSGRVTTVGYSRGYGNAVFVASPYGELVYGHSFDGSLRVGPGDEVSAGQWLANIGNTGNSDGAHLHFGFPGGTFGAAEALLGGALPPTGKVGDGKRNLMPKWAKDILAGPLDWMKGLIQKPIAKLKSQFGDTDLSRMVTDVPMELARRSVKFVKDLIPTKGEAWDAIIGNPSKNNIQAPGPESGLPGQQGSTASNSAWRGGILPYNGTMKYDAGGYLPPGLTSVVNLTGRPEPVFTAEQFSNLGIDAGGEGGITYAPTFQGTKLTPADVVDDLDFAMRKIRREGRYERNKL